MADIIDFQEVLQVFVDFPDPGLGGFSVLVLLLPFLEFELQVAVEHLPLEV